MVNTRRDFLSTVGPGGFLWKNLDSMVLTNLITPRAHVKWSLGVGDSPVLIEDSLPNMGILARTSRGIYVFSKGGRKQWQFEINRPNSNTIPDIAVERDTVYVDDSRVIWALDVEDGNVRWRYDGGDSPSVIDTSPRAVFVEDNDVVALSSMNGDELWRFATEAGVWPVFQYSRTNLYLGTASGRFYSLSADDGDVSWRIESSKKSEGRYGNSSPRVIPIHASNGLVYVWNSREGTVQVFDAETGSRRWRIRLKTSPKDFPGLFADGDIYIPDGQTFRAISADEGDLQWRFDADTKLQWHPKVSGNQVFIGGENKIYALSAVDGREQWQSDIGNFPVGLIDDTLIAQKRRDSIYGLSVSDGRIQWKYRTSSQFAWHPYVDGKTVYLGTTSGTAAAISHPTPDFFFDALGILTSPLGIATSSLLGGAFTVGAYYLRRIHKQKAALSDQTSFRDLNIIESIAKTNCTHIYEAHAPDGTLVTLKCFQNNTIDPNSFVTAVETWADLDVTNVLGVREWGLDPEPWVATEYWEASLAERVADPSTDFPMSELVHTIADAAETVHRVHREGVTHGGLAPDYVVFADGDVRVGDWRLAAELHGAPDGSDVERLAAMTRDLLGGDMSEELDDVLTRTLADDPADRYDSALEFADALRWAVRE